jgi:hypothetical protein
MITTTNRSPSEAPSAAAPAPLPSKDDVLAAIARLTPQCEQIREEIEAATKAIGRGYLAAAAGVDDQAGERARIVDLEVRARGIEAQLAEAKRDLETIERREGVAERIKRHRACTALVQQRRVIAERAGKATDDLAEALVALVANGREVLNHVRGIRGRDMLTPAGHIASSDITELARAENIQFIVERDMCAMVPGWRSEAGAGPATSTVLIGQSWGLQRAVDDLLGVDELDPADVAAVEAQLGPAPEASTPPADAQDRPQLSHAENEALAERLVAGLED